MTFGPHLRLRLVDRRTRLALLPVSRPAPALLVKGEELEVEFKQEFESNVPV